MVYYKPWSSGLVYNRGSTFVDSSDCRGFIIRFDWHIFSNMWFNTTNYCRSFVQESQERPWAQVLQKREKNRVYHCLWYTFFPREKRSDSMRWSEVVECVLFSPKGSQKRKKTWPRQPNSPPETGIWTPKTYLTYHLRRYVWLDVLGVFKFTIGLPDFETLGKQFCH